MISQIYCRGELSEEERGAYKWWLFDVSECDDDTSDAERSVWSLSYLYVGGFWFFVYFSCENAGECVELDGDLIDIESDSDGGDTEGTCTDMEDAVDIENAVIENLGEKFSKK